MKITPSNILFILVIFDLILKIVCRNWLKIWKQTRKKHVDLNWIFNFKKPFKIIYILFQFVILNNKSFRKLIV